MRAVKAVYENGNLSLREPVNLKGRHEVTVLVPEEDPDPEEVLKYAGMLRDLTPEQRRLYGEALGRKIRFTRQVEL
jgi:predicted DNA-binding antitoxin AbrB/MazE fold protein